MKKFKRLSVMLSLVLCVSMLFSGSVFAGEKNEKNDSSDLLSTAHEVINSYFCDELITQPKINSFSIGEKTPAYELYNNKLIPFDTTDYYPIFIDNNLYGMLLADFPNDPNQVSYTFGELFAPQLNEFIKQGNNEYCIVIDGAIGYLKYAKNAEIIFGDTLQTLEGSRNFINKTTNNINSIKNINSTDIHYNNSKIFATLPILNTLTRGAGGSKNLSVGKWKQSSTDGLCWAGTVECIGEYITKDKTYSPKSIETAMGVSPGAGGQNSDIANALSQLYSISNSELSPLSDTDVISKIDEDKPFHIAWVDYANWKAHAVTCRGYNDTGTNMTISIMDTSYGSFSTKTKNSNGQFTYKMGSFTLPWDSSIVPD